MVTGGEDKKVNMWAIGKPNVILVKKGFQFKPFFGFPMFLCNYLTQLNCYPVQSKHFLHYYK